MKKIVSRQKFAIAHDDYPMTFRADRGYISPDIFVNALLAEPGMRSILSITEFTNKKEIPDNPDFTNKKIFLSRTGGRGDFFFILRSVKEIKDNYSGVHTTFACGAKYKSMLETFFPTLIDQVITIPYVYDYYDKCDYFVTFEGAIEENPVASFVNAYDLMANIMKVNITGNHHLDIYIPRALKKRAEDIASTWETPMIGIQPKASAILRTYPLGYLKEVIEGLARMGFGTLLLDSKENIDIIRQSIPDCRMHEPFDSCGGSFELACALVKHCKAIITPDSAFTYIGDSLNIPTLTIFGPFSSALRVEKLDVYALEAIGKCYNCNAHSYNPCKRSTDMFSPCIKAITPEILFNAMRKVLNVKDM